MASLYTIRSYMNTILCFTVNINNKSNQGTGELPKLTINLLLLEKFWNRAQMLCVALRIVPNIPVHSNAVINYVITISLFRACCVTLFQQQ